MVSRLAVSYFTLGVFCLCSLLIVFNPHLSTLLEQTQYIGFLDRTFHVPEKEVTKINSTRTTFRERKNVLFIIVDDLRPQLGAFREPDKPDYFTKTRMYTPQLDRLAARSLVLRRTYVQQPLCGPSRASLLTSRRPDVTMAYGNNRYWREVGGNFTTLPQYFKQHGYTSLGFGKVFHTGASSGGDDPPSWSEPFYKPPFSDSHYVPKSGGAGWAAVSRQERDQVPLTDDLTIKQAKTALRELAPAALAGDKHFFVAVGLRKPHLSLVCPKEFFTKYPLESEDQYLAEKSWQTPEVRKRCGLGNTTTAGNNTVLPDPVLRKFRRAYAACVSYVDHNVGELLEQLERLGLTNSTVVSFMADHGYHLGENNHWGKMQPLEMSTRVPLMLHVPGVTDSGVVSDSIVEALDVYPTITEAAGLPEVAPCPVKSSNVRVCTMGRSLLPLVEQPDLELRSAAMSQVSALGDSTYTLRSPHLRYSERAHFTKYPDGSGLWNYDVQWDSNKNNTNTTKSELYDHRTDPLERFNVINDPKYSDDIELLKKQLRDMVDELHIESKRA